MQAGKRSTGPGPPQTTRTRRRGQPERHRRRLKPAERRAQLLEAALRVFAARGLSRGTHADIAQVCSVSVGTVFLYFPTREALVAGVLDEIERVGVEIAERCYQSGLPAPAAIRRHLRDNLDLLETEPAFGPVWLDWSTAVRDDIWPRYLAFQVRIVDLIATSIARSQRDGIVPTRMHADVCARLIVSSTQMLAQMKFTDEPRARIEAFGDAVVDMALGLAPGPLC